jgi:hypothetical protein
MCSTIHPCSLPLPPLVLLFPPSRGPPSAAGTAGGAAPPGRPGRSPGTSFLLLLDIPCMLSSQRLLSAVPRSLLLIIARISSALIWPPHLVRCRMWCWMSSCASASSAPGLPLEPFMTLSLRAWETSLCSRVRGRLSCLASSPAVLRFAIIASVIQNFCSIVHEPTHIDDQGQSRDIMLKKCDRRSSLERMRGRLVVMRHLNGRV